jgi:hypothetical protein
MKVKLLRDIETSIGIVKAGSEFTLKGEALIWLAIPLGKELYHRLYDGDYVVLKK